MELDFNQILQNLTIQGFFSEYLPPCFQLDKKILNYSPPKNCDLIAPYTYSMSRFNPGNDRRFISIPEIGSYLVTYAHFKKHDILKDLYDFCTQSKASFSPMLATDGSIMTHEQSYLIPSQKAKIEDKDAYSLYIDNVCKKISISAGARKVLHLDIANCFSSFYMHMIPSIILGYEKANENYLLSVKDKYNSSIDTKYKIYADLDSIVRRQNLKRTNGLLIGTQYSKILIEGILCRIDEELEQTHPELKYTRYVDDYDIYIFDGQRVDQVTSIFSNIFRKYGFAINSEKTEIEEYPFYVISNLQKIYSQANRSSMDKSALMKLFNYYLKLQKEGTKGAIRFLLKSIEASPINTEEKNLYKSYLLSILTNDTRSIIKACELLCKDDVKMSNEDINLVNNQLYYHLEENHDLEAVWLLYFLIKNNQIDDKTIKKVLEANNELAQILLLKNGYIQDNNIQFIVEKSSSWILIYELYADGKMDEQVFVNKLNVDKNLDFYKNLESHAISFCCAIQH